jgi:hypothetical protein
MITLLCSFYHDQLIAAQDLVFLNFYYSSSICLRSFEVKVAWNKCPGKAGSLGLGQNIAKSFQKVIPVFVIYEYFFAINPSGDNMMQGSWGIYS